jgi:hypothetical protein
MAKPVPWPASTWGPYQDIARRLPKLEAMILTCQEGSQERNKELLRRLLRLVYDRSRRIEESCKEIIGQLPKKRSGREPKWYQLTMDTQANILDIISLVEETNGALRAGEFIYIDKLLECIKLKIDQISKLLEEHPHAGSGSPDPVVWGEAVDKALNGFDY